MVINANEHYGRVHVSLEPTGLQYYISGHYQRGGGGIMWLHLCMCVCVCVYICTYTYTLYLILLKRERERERVRETQRGREKESTRVGTSSIAVMGILQSY